MKLAGVIFMACVAVAMADCYIQTRGLNNKNRYDVTNNGQTNNQNRLYDSQNNAKGGYPPSNTPPTYTVGSIVPLAWTVQHGLSNANLRSTMVMQYITSVDSPQLMLYEPAGKNDDTLDISLNQANRGGLGSTDPERSALNSQVPLTYVEPGQTNRGRRENIRTFVEGFHRLRNKGIYEGATQQVNNLKNRPYQTATRQNNDGDDNQHGVELATERDYYPHAHCSDFRDVAILVGDASNVTELCPFYQANSQNVKKRSACSKITYPTEKLCIDNGGTWSVMDCDFGIEPPTCGLAARTADNHLGNAQGEGNNQATNMYNFTIPAIPGSVMSMRLRYNISTNDWEGWGPNKVDHKHSGANSPLQQNQQFTIGNYANKEVKLQMSINVAQFGRVFEDQNEHWYVEEDNGNACPGGTTHNMYTRGKRGNIVQSYPGVEYMQLPRQPEIDLCDCLNFQMTGSGPNGYTNGQALYDNGQAGNGDQVDLHGMVCSSNDGVNTPLDMDDWTCVPDDIENRDEVMWNMATSCVDEGTDVDVELDGSKLYCNVGTFQYCERTTLSYFGPRNNAFTNRSEKASAHVGARNQLWLIAIAIAATLLAISLIAGGAALYAKKNPNSSVARLFQNGGNRGSGIMNSPRYK